MVVSLLNTHSPSQTLTNLHQLPHGYRFRPEDHELVQFFLYPKLTDPLFSTSAPVIDCDLYAHQPLQLWDAYHRLQGEDLFFFTTLKRSTPTSYITRKIDGGPALWHREDINHQIHVQIDIDCSVAATKKTFKYQNTQPGQGTGGSWLMYEYSLPSLSEVIVLCQLRRKDDDKSQQTRTTKKRKRDDDGVVDAANPISQKARVDQDYMQQQIMMAAEPVSEVVYNGVKFDNFESFSHEVVQDFDNDQMAVNFIPSSTNIAGPTVSTQDCVENLQLIQVVGIDHDGEPAATEQDDDYHNELMRLLYLSDCSGEADVVPDIQATTDQADPEVQATSIVSTEVESLTTEAVDHHLDSEVSDSSLSSVNLQKLLQATPEADHEVQATPIGSTLVEFRTTDAVDYDQMAAIASSTNIAAPTASTQNCAENLPPIEVVCIDDDGEPAATEEISYAYHKQLMQTLAESLTTDAVGHHLDSEVSDSSLGSSDLQKLLQATPEADHEVQASPIGSTLVESLTTDAFDSDLQSEVSDSSLSNDWRGSFS